MKKIAKKVVAVRLPKKHREWVFKKANKEGTSVTSIIFNLIKTAMEGENNKAVQNTIIRNLSLKFNIYSR